MRVRDIIEAKGGSVFSVRPGDTVLSASETLSAHGVGAVVVMDETRRLAGILSERDIVRRLGEGGEAVLAKPVSEIMTANVHTCRLDDDVDDLMQVMTARRIRHLPVAGQGGGVTGMISIGDVVKRVIDEKAREAEELKAYIAAV